MSETEIHLDCTLFTSACQTHPSIWICSHFASHLKDHLEKRQISHICHVQLQSVNSQEYMYDPFIITQQYFHTETVAENYSLCHNTVIPLVGFTSSGLNNAHIPASSPFVTSSMTDFTFLVERKIVGRFLI